MQYIKHGEEKIEKERKRVKALAVSSSNTASLKQQKIDRNRNILARRNADLTFSSKKRKVFEALRDIGKQDRLFVVSVSNLLTKTMLSKGFEYIKEASRDNQKDRKKFRHLNLMILRFLKTNIGEYFSIWKN